MSSLTEQAIVDRLLALSEPYANRPLVARRQTLPTLAKFLRHPHRAVRLGAARALCHLASHPHNAVFVCHEGGVLPALRAAYHASGGGRRRAPPNDGERRDGAPNAATEWNDDGEEMDGDDLVGAVDEEMVKIVEETFAALRPALEADAGLSTMAGEGSAMRCPATARGGARVLHSARAARSVTIRVDGVGSAGTKMEIEGILQSMRGVVSYVIDVDKRCVRLFASVPTATVMNVLRGRGFACEILEDTEWDVGEGNNAAPTASEGGGTSSSYWKAGRRALGALRQAVVPCEDTSLASRIAKQKAESQRQTVQEGRSHIAAFIDTLVSKWW